MPEVIKSIFRQREIEKIYKVITNNDFNYLRNTTCTTISMIDVAGNKSKVLSDKEIGRYDIEIPMLEVGDEFFLHDKQELIKIKSKMRSSDGSITYYAEDKIIETENTQKTLEYCMKEMADLNYEKEELKNLKKEFENYKKEYKYKNRFFNKKSY